MTYESFVDTPSEPQQETLLGETRNIDQKTIGTLRESSSALQSTLGDIPVHTTLTSCLAILQIIYLIVRVSRERELKQTLQIHSLDLVAPTLGGPLIQMAAEIPPSSQCSYTEACTFCGALDRFTGIGCVVSGGSLGVLVLDPSLVLDPVFPCRIVGRGLSRIFGELASVEEQGVV